MIAPDKYRDLIDQDTWDFIERTLEFYPADTASAPIQQQREIYNRLCAAFSVDYPESMKSEDFSISAEDRSINCRRYCTDFEESPRAQILYFHGGGYVVGGLHSHDSFCAEICHATGLPLTAVDYRLAPEHHFPADLNDAISAYRHLMDNSFLPVILLGDSAGGNIAAALAHASRRERRQPIGQILVYPTLGNDFGFGSYLEHANAPMLTTEDMLFYAKMRTKGDLDQWNEKELSPLNDADFTNLPRTTVFAAQCDPLRDDGERYCEKINQAGGQAAFVEEIGLPHTYLLARHCVDRARNAFKNIVTALMAMEKSV